jgi:predicted nucleic acid-binding protein
MILLDTNVLIYAFDIDSQFCKWARETIVGAVAGDGASINAVSLAEICVGDADPPTVADRIRSWGVEILDVPAAAAHVCAAAYRQYRKRRMSVSDIPTPNLPLPDFFIGAHAETMGWELATTDQSRFHTYFPSVSLKMPRRGSDAGPA